MPKNASTGHQYYVACIRQRPMPKKTGAVESTSRVSGSPTKGPPSAEAKPSGAIPSGVKKPGAA
ncbi:MAG: hypothetical protein WBD71_09415, partial [Xanthobacteraceae bacterium]